MNHTVPQRRGHGQIPGPPIPAPPGAGPPLPDLLPAGTCEVVATGATRPDPNAVQDVLHTLGVTSPDLLQRAADIDCASEQLIIEAAGQGGMRHTPPSPATPDKSASSPALIHGARVSGEPRAATLPPDPASGRQHEPPEAEL